MYRFLFTRRWLGIAALTILLAAGMVIAGRWQLDRYQTRSAINARIDAAATARPTPIADLLPDPSPTVGDAGPKAPADVQWSRVSITGQYDQERNILVRGRTRDGRVGFEVLTPLRLGDRTAVLVDRGWIPPADGDATTLPTVPPAPSGQVTVTARVAGSESGDTRLRHTDGRIDVRRISVPRLADELPYQLFGSYVLLDPRQAGGDGLATIASPRQNAWLNGGYAAQWWIFAVLTLLGFGWLVRREASGSAPQSTVPA